MHEFIGLLCITKCLVYFEATRVAVGCGWLEMNHNCLLAFHEIPLWCLYQ